MEIVNFKKLLGLPRYPMAYLRIQPDDIIPSTRHPFLIKKDVFFKENITAWEIFPRTNEIECLHFLQSATKLHENLVLLFGR